MANLVNVILTIFIVAQFEGIQCKPLTFENEDENAARHMSAFKPQKKEWVPLHHSWGLPHFPSLSSVSNLFQDEDYKEKIATKKRLEALEKNQKKILAILQELNDGMSAKNNQTKPESSSEKPQTLIPSSVPATVSTPVPSTMSSTSLPSSMSTSLPSTMSSTLVPSTVSTPVSSTASSSISSTASSTPVTPAPTIETSTVQDITQQPQSSPSSEESQPRIPDQNENANSDSNSNTADNQVAADSAGQQSSPAPDTNFGSIIGFVSDDEKSAETTESTA